MPELALYLSPDPISASTSFPFAPRWAAGAPACKVTRVTRWVLRWALLAIVLAAAVAALERMASELHSLPRREGQYLLLDTAAAVAVQALIFGLTKLRISSVGALSPGPTG